MRFLYLIFGIVFGLLIGFYIWENKCPKIEHFEPIKLNYNKIDSAKQVEIKIREDIGKIVLVPTHKLKQEIKQLSVIDTTCIPLIARLTEQIDKRDSIIALQNDALDNKQFQLAEAYLKIDTLQQKLDSCGLDYNNLYSESRNKDEKIAKLEQKVANKNKQTIIGSLISFFIGLGTGIKIN